MTTPHDIITEARSWLGTRFHHQGRVRVSAAGRGGCDCLGLIVGVAKALELNAQDGSLLASHDTLHYGRTPDGRTLQQTLEGLLAATELHAMRQADIVLMRFEHEPQHVGLVGGCPEELTLIHCYAAARKVVEHRLDDQWRGRIVAAYRFPFLTHE